MFTGFTDETVQFFLDLRFHNNTSYFHENHDRYLETVQKPFYEFIEDLAPHMRKVDPLMEVLPYKCLSHIHRDTRFSKDKSPYRDHLWFLFRRAAEPREKSLMYYFEFGQAGMGWGLGFWGENRECMDQFRRKMVANPDGVLAMIDDLDLDKRKLILDGRAFRRLEIPPVVPPRLQPWYRMREMYIAKANPDYKLAFSDRVFLEVKRDFLSLSPLYQYLRGICDENQT